MKGRLRLQARLRDEGEATLAMICPTQFLQATKEVHLLYHDPRTPPAHEHFIVWMRSAGLPTFRKLYARIDETLEAGSTYTVKVNTGFNVTSFLGKKRLVLSTTSWMGGKNSFLGIAYIVVGSISLLLGVVFLVMDKIKPRKLGDTNYLVWS